MHWNTIVNNNRISNIEQSHKGSSMDDIHTVNNSDNPEQDFKESLKNINKYCFLQCLLIQYNQNMYFHCVRSVYTKKTDFKIKFEIGL